MVFKVYNLRNKMRDIDICIAWHNSGRTLEDVAKEYKVTKERVRQIHHKVLRTVLGYIQVRGSDFASKKDHCTEALACLMMYKMFLEDKGF